MPQWLEYIKDGGTVTLIFLVSGFIFKVAKRLDRDESLRNDYPPHKHIKIGNEQTILYPYEFANRNEK